MMDQILKKISFCLILSLLCFFQTSHAQNGIVKSYYTDGTVQWEVSYVNDVLDGAYITYFSNGKVKTEKNFSKGILDGYVREYYGNGLMKEEYLVKSGIKDGSHRTFFENGQLKELINYSDGKLTSRQIFDSDFEDRIPNNPSIVQKKQETVIPTEKQIQKIQESVLPAKEIAEKKEEIILGRNAPEILCDAQVCPVPIGGMKGIQNNLVYPEHALRYGLEGTVTIIATINAQGDVIKTQVLKGLGLGCSEAAQDVIRKTKFIPGKSNGELVETNATINIEFKIFEKKSVQ
jgi:TonB family protein